MRTTVHIEDDLLGRARRIVPGRGLSRLVNEALSGKLAALERRQIDEAMKEGYLATQEDRAGLNEAWGAVDGEAWPA